MKQRGFTIVELLIVIVVIAILAAITIVAYNGIQGRAKDSTRLSDMTAIRKALELYKTANGQYPEENAASWEYSTTDPQNFLSALKPYMTKIPVDPANDANNFYYYYLYDAGSAAWGVTCPVGRGKFYVLGAWGLDAGGGITSSPGWNCENGSTVPTNSSWVPTGARAVWGSFTN
ncbi:MAG TPA: prepilin-type N-terminal cleavage/methylation domain-containing protein [Candidatus Saccharimonadales bacterium]